MNVMALKPRQIAIRIVQHESKVNNPVWFNHSMNMDHDSKLGFVHNP